VPKLRCVQVEHPNRMFTNGLEYEATLEGRLYRVIDNLGHARYVLQDTLRFIVWNGDEDSARWTHVQPRYAHFELMRGEN
jgi:hypothetical protein